MGFLMEVSGFTSMKRRVTDDVQINHTSKDICNLPGGGLRGKT